MAYHELNELIRAFSDGLSQDCEAREEGHWTVFCKVSFK